MVSKPHCLRQSSRYEGRYTLCRDRKMCRLSRAYVSYVATGHWPPAGNSAALGVALNFCTAPSHWRCLSNFVLCTNAGVQTLHHNFLPSPNPPPFPTGFSLVFVYLLFASRLTPTYPPTINHGRRRAGECSAVLPSSPAPHFCGQQ
jgi:hypothetical protein